MHPFLYPLETLENGKVFYCFKGVEKGCTGSKWVNIYDKVQDEGGGEGSES